VVPDRCGRTTHLLGKNDALNVVKLNGELRPKEEIVQPLASAAFGPPHGLVNLGDGRMQVVEIAENTGRGAKLMGLMNPFQPHAGRNEDGVIR